MNKASSSPGQMPWAFQLILTGAPNGNRRCFPRPLTKFLLLMVRDIRLQSRKYLTPPTLWASQCQEGSHSTSASATRERKAYQGHLLSLGGELGDAGPGIPSATRQLLLTQNPNHKKVQRIPVCFGSIELILPNAG